MRGEGAGGVERRWCEVVGEVQMTVAISGSEEGGADLGEGENSMCRMKRRT
jgi:hypothetical protein